VIRKPQVSEAAPSETSASTYHRPVRYVHTDTSTADTTEEGVTIRQRLLVFVAGLVLVTLLVLALGFLT